MARLVVAAERRIGEPVPSQTLDAQNARVRDPKHWRRFLVHRVRVARFQNIRCHLDKHGGELGDLWDGEPHEDGCPHRQHWLMSGPQHERAVLAAFLNFLPGQLKLRRDENGGGDVAIDPRG